MQIVLTRSILVGGKPVAVDGKPMTVETELGRLLINANKAVLHVDHSEPLTVAESLAALPDEEDDVPVKKDTNKPTGTGKGKGK